MPSSGSISRRGVTTRSGRRATDKGATPSSPAATRRAATAIGARSSAAAKRSMTLFFDHPFLLFLAAVVVQWGAAYAGDFMRRRLAVPAEDRRADFDLVRAATLTLLGLIIGFSFQM